ncbi:putative F-box protein At1g67623 [Manihot esculenta]|uniref:Uncharacterized protein n=1 Tax=Manihot esculenta TaxID=3983 RepID=A0ACB7GVH0_MANES|nr:putative F-box protein At1g67623 [Manihot esculenta]KAG8643951.1 hypothetical protein MANES_11G084185v8 [Manihot esculenta]
MKNNKPILVLVTYTSSVRSELSHPLMKNLNPTKRITKRRRKNYHQRFKYVPKELLTEILAQVASSSVTDFVNARACCKEFLEAASEDYVFEHVTMDSFPVILWKINHGVSSFLERCKKSGNPEALFRQGMIDYFSTSNYDSGLKMLERAASKGHAQAIYVYGIILVCYDGELRNKGVKLLSDLKRSKSSLVITECRKKVQNITWSMWLNNYIVGIGPAEEEEYMKKRKTCSYCNSKLALCSFTNDQTKNSAGWTSSDEVFEDDPFSCDSCLWDLEAILFCKMLRTGSYRP